MSPGEVPAAATLELLCDGKPLVVRTSSALVGRTPACTIRIVHPLVSREHCRIEFAREGVHVEDLGSMNGTWVNGARIAARTRVASGDRIGLGRDGVVLTLCRATLDGVDVATTPREEDMKTMVAGDPRALGAVPRVEVAPGARSAPVADEPPTAGLAPTREASVPPRPAAPLEGTTGAIPVMQVVDTSELEPILDEEEETLPILPSVESPPRFWPRFAAGALAGLAVVALLASCTSLLDPMRGLLRGAP